jgi:hypothetical protein
MAIIVEDGTGKANAESYATVAFADQYHSDRGNAAWAALTVAVKEAALRNATGYMLQNYRPRWQSFRVTAAQALDWPRAWVRMPDAPYGYGSFAAFVANNVVPNEVQWACVELALIASTADLNPTLSQATLEEKVAEIAVKYDHTSPQYKRYRKVDMFLTPYLTGSSVSHGLVRA